MISILARKAGKKRAGVLRGVYEENLAMLGRGRRSLHARRKYSLFKRSAHRAFLFAAGCLMALLIHGQYKGRSSSLALTASVKPVPRDGSAASPDRIKPALAGNAIELLRLEGKGGIPLSRMLGLGVKSIVIDAGHGGNDQGTVGRQGTQEKDMTLDIAKRVKAHLLRGGFSNIRMTREGDSYVSLQDRVAFVRNSKADLLLSIHINWLPNTPINAVETYYFGPSGDPKALKLAEKENMGAEYGLSDFKKILEKLGTDMKLQESRKLAVAIQSSLFLNSKMQNEDIKNNGVKRAPFVVLLGPDVPSVIAEVSCLSNTDEERKLNSENHRENIAGYLAAGIINYLNGSSLK